MRLSVVVATPLTSPPPPVPVISAWIAKSGQPCGGEAHLDRNIVDAVAVADFIASCCISRFMPINKANEKRMWRRDERGEKRSEAKAEEDDVDFATWLDERVLPFNGSIYISLYTL